MREVTVIDKLEDFRSLLSETRTIAAVGLSSDPECDAYCVSSYLQRRGYRIVGVHPGTPEVLGEPCYPSLSEIPEDVRREIDLVAVFRRSDAVPAIEEAARLGLRTLWLQIGVASPAALETAARHEVRVVANKCLRVVHGLLGTGGLPAGGGA